MSGRKGIIVKKKKKIRQIILRGEKKLIIVELGRVIKKSRPPKFVIMEMYLA